MTRLLDYLPSAASRLHCADCNAGLVIEPDPATISITETDERRKMTEIPLWNQEWPCEDCGEQTFYTTEAAADAADAANEYGLCEECSLNRAARRNLTGPK